MNPMNFDVQLRLAVFICYEVFWLFFSRFFEVIDEPRKNAKLHRGSSGSSIYAELCVSYEFSHAEPV